MDIKHKKQLATIIVLAVCIISCSSGETPTEYTTEVAKSIIESAGDISLSIMMGAFLIATLTTYHNTQKL